jgi:acetylcholinesterase
LSFFISFFFGDETQFLAVVFIPLCLAGYMFISGTTGASELISLLKKNVVIRESSTYNYVWVYNGRSSTGFKTKMHCTQKMQYSNTSPSPHANIVVPGLLGNCLAVNTNTGSTDWILCSTKLPTVCYNNVMRRNMLLEDSTRQIKLDVPGVGVLQGSRDQNSFRFLGIPYAEPPIGNLRFAAPVAKAPFTSILDATYYKNVCPQSAPSDGIGTALVSGILNGAKESEDCLTLNVYTSSLRTPGQEPLPVMFYIHGGGFTT